MNRSREPVEKGQSPGTTHCGYPIHVQIPTTRSLLALQTQTAEKCLHPWRWYLGTPVYALSTGPRVQPRLARETPHLTSDVTGVPLSSRHSMGHDLGMTDPLVDIA